MYPIAKSKMTDIYKDSEKQLETTVLLCRTSKSKWICKLNLEDVGTHLNMAYVLLI
jgi:hypothetical protein